MNIPIQKLKAIILYFCEHTDPKFLGKVKLMKLFYFLDFLHVKKYAAPVTYDRYVKLEHGPIPSIIKSLVDDAGEDMQSSVLADVIDIERPEGISMFKVVCRRELTQNDLDWFSQSELQTLATVCARFGDKNTDFIVNASHKEAPWKESEWFQEIPYALAAKDGDCEVGVEDINLMLEIAM